LAASKAAIKKSEATLETIQAKFSDTEVTLKKLNRERAAESAVTMAAVNAQLNENAGKSLAALHRIIQSLTVWYSRLENFLRRVQQTWDLEVKKSCCRWCRY
jgi:hypothetical protein